MAVPDYKKEYALTKDWDKDSKKREKFRTDNIEKVRKIALNTEDKLRKDSIVWKGYYKHLYGLHQDWYKIADQIIKLQDEQKAAAKSKDKAKLQKLKKEIGQLDGKAAKLRKKWMKNYDELAKVDAGLKKIIGALLSLPS